jgi:hypothetical protein
MVSALGIGEAALYAAGPTRFPDVPADHWASGYINVAVDVGVVVGYPDGTFLPENQVTFAEAIKMIVAGLGYTPKAEALGGYPGGYLAVAAEEEITDGVNVAGSLAANRGAIAMMVDNALEVELMEQVSFGDSPRWETVDKTLLKNKLGVEEVKGTVTAISKTAKLDENEFELEDENGKRIGTFEMAIDVNTESLFLKEVKILHKDEKVVWVSVETDDRDIVFDTIASIDGRKFELKVADKKYDTVRRPTIYVNYDDGEEPKPGDYGYFIFDGKEIIAANLFRFDPEGVDGRADKGFVTDVLRDEIEYIDLYDADEQVLELDDYDEIYVYNRDFTKMALADIDEGSLIFYWDNDDELFIMVLNEMVEGEVTRLRSDRVTIDGTNYVRAENESIVSLDQGKKFEPWGDASRYEIMDEDVQLYLDLNGEVAAMVTDAKVTSDTLYGIVTWYYEGRNPCIAVYTADDKEEEYYFEKRDDAAGVKVYEDEIADGDLIVAIEYKLNSDGEIAEDSVTLKISERDEISVIKAADRKYVVAGSDTYYISSDTVVMRALDEDGELDPEVIDYDTLVDMSIAPAEDVIIFGEKGKDADMIVFLDEEFKGRRDDVYFGVVIDDPWKIGSDWFAEMDIFGEGKGEYKLKSHTQVKEGDLIAFYLDRNNKTDVIVCGVVYDNKPKARIVVGTVYNRDGSYIEIGDTEPDGLSGDYRIASGAVLYQLDGKEIDLDKYGLDGTIRLSRINKGDRIAVLYDLEEKEVVAAIVAPQ